LMLAIDTYKVELMISMNKVFSLHFLIV